MLVIDVGIVFTLLHDMLFIAFMLLLIEAVHFYEFFDIQLSFCIYYRYLHRNDLKTFYL